MEVFRSLVRSPTFKLHTRWKPRGFMQRFIGPRLDAVAPAPKRTYEALLRKKKSVVSFPLIIML